MYIFWTLNSFLDTNYFYILINTTQHAYNFADSYTSKTISLGSMERMRFTHECKVVKIRSGTKRVNGEL